MVGITVVVTAGMVSFLILSNPGPSDNTHTDLTLRLEPGPDGIWGTAGDRIVLIHRGGEPLHQATTQIAIDHGSTAETFSGGGLVGGKVVSSGFSGDATMMIGESWVLEDTLKAGSKIVISVVRTGSDAKLIASKEAAVPLIDCTGETTPPDVLFWLQDPGDLSTSSGSTGVKVTARVVDGCSGVDETITPKLEYRLSSVNGFSTLTMTHLGAGTRTWEATIPDLDWKAHPFEELLYKVTGMADREGNVGDSSVQADLIDLVGISGFVQSATAAPGGGTVADLPKAQSMTDNGAAMSLAEIGGGGTKTSTVTGNVVENSGVTNPQAATGSPNGVYAELNAAGSYATVSGYNALSGTITKLEACIAYQFTGTHQNNGGQADDIAFDYRVGAASFASVTLQSLNPTGTFTRCTELTGPGGSWDWTEVSQTQLRATWQIKNTQDTGPVRIDALYLRVTHDGTVYNLDVELGFGSLTGGTVNVLELRYRVGGPEDFTLQIHDGTTWVTQPSGLTSNAYLTWSKVLSNEEMTAGPRVRIIDAEVAQGDQSILYIDYARVVSIS